MKLYALSLAAGVLVGIVYSLLSVRSPAPPLVALVGLLGILLGEQIIPVGKQLLAGDSFRSACNQTHATDHVLGALPGRPAPATTAVPTPPPGARNPSDRDSA
ncbi:XapX domain-containing protein [Diaphorobacter ruginosibacter]|uniref:XapX domain-containing protein n=1 Tax=Diaphorobacter ruginosibacter TaxID=1715720 RepID=A0A7G9RJL8_9BURK|nr:XapX domain-containing protein [Diaphorobacter ruginosibacter]QNN55793.1 XapX domain-containing protein [Diaphorobacter ruginosibacter]